MWSDERWTPLWREAHFQVNMHKTHQDRTTCGSCDVEKVHAVVARSTFASQNLQNTPCSDGAKHISKPKCTKHTSSGPLLEVEMSKKCTPLWREAHFEVKMLKAQHVRTTFGRDCAPCQKWAKREGFVACPKTMAGVGHLKRICKDTFSVAGAIQETYASEMLGGPGADFLRDVAFWSIRSSVWGRWFCVTGATLRMTWPHFSWQAQYFRQVGWKNRKTHWHEAVSSALSFPFLAPFGAPKLGCFAPISWYVLLELCHQKFHGSGLSKPCCAHSSHRLISFAYTTRRQYSSKKNLFLRLNGQWPSFVQSPAYSRAWSSTSRCLRRFRQGHSGPTWPMPTGQPSWHWLWRTPSWGHLPPPLPARLMLTFT